MKLAQVPRSSVVANRPELWPGNRQVVGSCIAMRPVLYGAPIECRRDVVAGEGYAGVDGTPWRAYYCPDCAARLMAAS